MISGFGNKMNTTVTNPVPRVPYHVGGKKLLSPLWGGTFFVVACGFALLTLASTIQIYLNESPRWPIWFSPMIVGSQLLVLATHFRMLRGYDGVLGRFRRWNRLLVFGTANSVGFGVMSVFVTLIEDERLFNVFGVLFLVVYFGMFMGHMQFLAAQQKKLAARRNRLLAKRVVE
jgi:hypothetical protein